MNCWFENQKAVQRPAPGARRDASAAPCKPGFDFEQALEAVNYAFEPHCVGPRRTFFHGRLLGICCSERFAIQKPTFSISGSQTNPFLLLRSTPAARRPPSVPRLCRRLKLTVSHSLTHTHSLTLATLTHTHSHTLTHTHTQSHSRALTHSHSLTLTQSLTGAAFGRLNGLMSSSGSICVTGAALWRWRTDFVAGAIFSASGCVFAWQGQRLVGV